MVKKEERFYTFVHMYIPFVKYQGTGNDFIIIDNRQSIFSKNDTKLVARLCDRKFGIGADGLILLEDAETSDFNMVYFNADGNKSTMCGNGGRCIVHFANSLGIIGNSTKFEAIDGLHLATIEKDDVSLLMTPVHNVSTETTYSFLDTGSPHHVMLVPNVDVVDVYKEGKKIRNNNYGSHGANVNFVTKISNDIFKVRTYERGVENETLSCGTGVTAVAIAMYERGETTSTALQLETQGGTLEVAFAKTDQGYEKVYLSGPAIAVFKGEITV